MALRRLPIVFEFVPVSSYEEAHLLPSLLPLPPFPGSALQVPPGLELLDGVHNGLGLAVYFNVHDASDGLLTQRRNPQRLGDEVKVEFPLVVAHLAHRQRDPVDRDVPLGQDVLCILWVSQPDPKPHVPVSSALLLAKRRGSVHASPNTRSPKFVLRRVSAMTSNLSSLVSRKTSTIVRHVPLIATEAPTLARSRLPSGNWSVNVRNSSPSSTKETSAFPSTIPVKTRLGKRRFPPSRGRKGEKTRPCRLGGKHDDCRDGRVNDPARAPPRTPQARPV